MLKKPKFKLVIRLAGLIKTVNTMSMYPVNKAEKKLIEKIGRTTAYLKHYQTTTTHRENLCKKSIKTVIEMVETQDLETEEGRERAKRLFSKNFGEVLEDVLAVVGLMQEEEDVISQFRMNINQHEERLQQIRNQMEEMIQQKEKKDCIKQGKSQQRQQCTNLLDDLTLFGDDANQEEDQYKSSRIYNGKKMVKADEQSLQQTEENQDRFPSNHQYFP